jgi:hypothetical protein
MNAKERTSCKNTVCPALMNKTEGANNPTPDNPTGQWVWQAGMTKS